MLKKVLFYLSEQLYKRNEMKTLLSDLQKREIAIQEGTEQEAETFLQSIFGIAKEEVICVTDSAIIYNLAQANNLAVLPIAENEEALDSFQGAEYLLLGMEGLDFEYLQRIYKRYYRQPWTILETERTIVREMTVDDVEALYQIYQEPSITAYTEGLFEDICEERAYVENYIDKVYKLYEFGVWIIEDKLRAGQIIGRAGFSMREEFKDPELGYIIAVPYQRQGYGREVCEAILKYGYKQLAFTKVRVLMDEENIASRCLCEKLGFSFDGKITLNQKELLQYVGRADTE